MRRISNELLNLVPRWPAVVTLLCLAACSSSQNESQQIDEPQPIGTHAVTLSWTAPVSNEDDSPLTDLSGYKFYWGTTPGNYPNSVRVDNPGITVYVIDNLAPGTYDFVVTAINANGNESARSNVATVTLL